MRGSNRSETISQKPEPSTGPAPEMCKYTSTAANGRALDVSHHSIRNRTPLAAKDAGTTFAGDIMRVPLEFRATRTSDTAEVAMSIVGNAV